VNLDRSSPANLQSAVLTHRLTARHVKWLSDVVSTTPFVSVKPGHAHALVLSPDHLPLALMHRPVMTVAEEYQVVEIGVALARPT